MVKINDTTTFPNTAPALTDHIPGTDVSNTANDANGETVTFTLQATMDLFEANFAAPASAISSGTFADARIAETNVTQHQAALSVTESQISDLGTYTVAATLASTANGNGASLVGVEDSAGNFTATTAEGVFAELQDNIVAEAQYSDNTYLKSGDVTNKVQHFNAGGSATALKPSGSSQYSFTNWFQNGFDLPDDAGPNDIYNLPDGLDVLTAEATAARDLTTSDVGGEIRFTGTDPVYTIELEATNAVSYGSTAMPWVDLINDSSTNLTVQGATSVTVNGTSAGSAVIKPGGRGRVWRTTTANTWLVFGDLVDYELETIQVVCSAAGEDLATGTGAVTFRMPFAMTLTDVRASVATAPTGSEITVDINEGGTTILSTKLTIDATEKTSTTAATAAVISDSALADDAEITIDIDAVGSTVAGTDLVVTLIGYRA